MRSVFWLLGSLALALALTSPALATEPGATDIALAKAHFQTGQIYYDAQRYPDAAREFEEAYRLSRRTAFLFNMGRSYDHVGDAARALSAYRRYLESPASVADTAEARARIEELVHAIARVDVVASVAGARVSIDGVVAGVSPLSGAELNPGSHAFELSSEGYATWRTKLELKADEARSISAELVSLVKVIRVADKTPVYKRWWPWTIAAVLVAAGAVTGGVLGSRAAQGTPIPQARLPELKP